MAAPVESSVLRAGPGVAASNRSAFGPNQSRRFASFTDGLSQSILGAEVKTYQQAFHDYIAREARGKVRERAGNPEHGEVEAYGRKLRTGVYRIGVFPDEIAEQAARYESRQHVLEALETAPHYRPAQELLLDLTGKKTP